MVIRLPLRRLRTLLLRLVVESFEVTDPESVKIIESAPDRIWTLVTCFPFRYIGLAPKRLVVHARLAASTGLN